MQLQPGEWALDSVEALLAERSGGGWVYGTIITLAAGALICLPLVKVPVTVRATGILRPAAEVYQVRAAASGTLAELRVSLHDVVFAGDTIARVDAPGPRQEVATARSELAALDRHRADLLALRADSTGTRPANAEAHYRHTVFRERAGALRGHIDSGHRELARAIELHNRGLLPDAVLDQRADDLAAAERELNAFLAEQRTRVEEELRALEERRRGLIDRIEHLETLLSDAYVVAPLGGTIESLGVTERGVFVAAGDPIALISPDTAIVGVISLSDRDVPHLSVGQPVRLSFHSFPAAVWGTVDGVLTGLSSDLIPGKDRPTFAATVTLVQDRLHSRESNMARLRKGLGFDAHFVVQRRTLLSFLHEDLARLLTP